MRIIILIVGVVLGLWLGFQAIDWYMGREFQYNEASCEELSYLNPPQERCRE